MHEFNELNTQTIFAIFLLLLGNMGSSINGVENRLVKIADGCRCEKRGGWVKGDMCGRLHTKNNTYILGYNLIGARTSKPKKI